MTLARRIDLCADWQFCSSEPDAYADPFQANTSAEAQWLPATLPTTVAAALRSLGRWSIDGAPRDFDTEDWWFRLRFDRPVQLDTGRWMLGFDGLASLAEVWLNGRSILRSENMFLDQVVDVGDLAPGNELHLCFRSLRKALSRRRARPRWRAPMIDHQQLRWFRTTLLGRTPGWSPPASPVGPWKDIWIAEAAAVLPRDLQIRARMSGASGVVELHCTRTDDAMLSRLAGAKLTLSYAGRLCGSTALAPGAAGFEARLCVDDPQRWWPHTHGSPETYEVALEYQGPHAAPTRLPLGAVGFRTVQIDRGGNRFDVVVNGVPVFCRGATWTPLDPVSLAADPQALESALRQVSSAGLNMLRISGALVPESGEFLALCDALGILVWHDLPFANMDYPAEDEGFRANVCRETQRSLERLARHASVAVICGNSEVEQQAAMWGAPRSLWTPELFHRTFAEMAAKHCPEVPYWPSSAHGGPLPHFVREGTTSYYGVGAYLRPLSDAGSCGVRFATECLAFANVPENRTLEALPAGGSPRVHHPAWKARVPRDLGAGWDFDDVRDHYLRDLHGVDPLSLRYADPSRYLDLSRRVSADAMVAAFARWRSDASSCGGALVWFLRDLWPGAGWGIIDSFGRPKAPYYALRRILQPQWLTLLDDGLDGLTLHCGNEGDAPMAGTLDLRILRQGRHLVTRSTVEVELPARCRKAIPVAAVLDEFHDVTRAYRFGPPSSDLVVAELRIGRSGTVHRAFHLPDPAAHLAAAPDLELSAQATRIDEQTWRVKVRSAGFANSVHLDVPGFCCDDQYFHVPPGGEHELTATSEAASASIADGWITALNARAPVRLVVLPVTAPSDSG